MMITLPDEVDPLTREIHRRHVDERQELYTIARALSQPLQRVRQIAQDARIVLHQLVEFCTRHRGARLVVLDLETTGLPRTTHFGVYPTWTDSFAYDPSRIVQLAYTEWTLGEPVPSRDAVTTRLRRPEGFVCSPKAEAVHGLTTARLEHEGVRFVDILHDAGLVAALRQCDYVVAHNAGFDVNILRNECFRAGWSTEDITALLPEHKVVCTCKLTQYTKLGTLHTWFYPDAGLQFHDAGEDVWALVQILAAAAAAAAP
jgi:DNA polymerase III epsilon subunit-like protein